jgi:hypothetical protein
MMAKNDRLGLVAVLVLLLSAPSLAQAQLDPVAQNLQDLKGKLLILRQCAAESDIRFFADGSSSTPLTIGPVFLNGIIEVESASVDRNWLRLKGNRVLVYFEGKDAEMKPLRTEDKITIGLESAALKWNREEIDRVLARYFEPAPYYEWLRHEYWKRLVPEDKKELIAAARERRPIGMLEDSRPVFLVEPKLITPPQTLVTPSPEFPAGVSRSRRVTAESKWKVVISEYGFPEVIWLPRPLNDPFDKASLSAIRRWRFKPAMKDGKPVASRINIEVGFY